MKIIQKDNFNSNFGFCLRSSSIFYIPPKPVRSRIVFSNYWKFKNNIDVFILINYREISGNLVRRESINFEGKNVIELEIPEDFTGSCEIEAFANKDLKIPYSAIMAVYESENSISMVHSYSRVYSQIELEDEKVICDGREGCWTLRDDKKIESFAVLHNGSKILSKQIITLSISNCKNEHKKINFPLKALKPYETCLIKPNKYFKNLSDFLNGEDGSCKIKFKLSSSFTRLLVGWQTIDKKELQVTHYNFDYSSHETDLIDCKNNFGYMVIPNINKEREIYTLIYPDRSPGNYFISSEKITKLNIKKTLEIIKTESQDLKFEREDGMLPSRIVTALKIKSTKESILPCECSLGITHNMRPKKRFHWGIVSAKFNSSILLTAIKDIYGDPKDSNICLKLYSQKTDEAIQRNLNWDEISEDGRNGFIEIKSFFKKSEIDFERYMYVSIFSHYGGFFVYTTLEKGGSFSIEHTF